MRLMRATLAAISQRCTVRLSFTPALILLSSLAAAQAPSSPTLAITPALAAQHLKSSPPPAYPTMVTPYHLSGVLQVSVSIDTSGHVSQATWVEPATPTPESSDPSTSTSLVNMLSSYAVTAIKAWTYTPFDHDGAPVAVNTTVSVPFDFAAKTSSTRPTPGYDQSLQACHESMKDDVASPLQVAACKKAADAADTLPSNFLERVSVYTFASGAFSRNHQFHDALTYANKAIDSAKQGQDDGVIAGSAYAARALAEASLGQFEAADQDQYMAEEYVRAAIRQMDETHVGEFNRSTFVHTLKSMLTSHAQMLTAQGNTAAAESITEEAAKLK
jgi:hypothetical protein